MYSRSLSSTKKTPRVHFIKKENFYDCKLKMIACDLSKQERKIRKNSDEQKKKEYIHKVLKILYEYGTKECAPMVEKRIKDIYKEYYEEDVDYVALKHRYNQYMLEKEEEIRAHIQKNNDIRNLY